ncbi:MAG: SDR family NAD(P)-dependent oxidoreductase [Lewinellaceae bacterium]|nr:SDR family NAD(P)-dependent oxidoreductase [Lewinellaceae bacterium]
MQQAIITGGSSGIGLTLAKELAAQGYALLLVAKPPAELDQAVALLREQFPDLVLATLAIDLSLPNSAQDVYDYARENGWTEVSLLINCAGFGTFGFIDEVDMDREAAMIQLHILTLYTLTRLFLHEMIQRDRGYIVNLSSISAFQPNPQLATYGATKAFVLQFSRAIDVELRDRGSQVRVMAVCPTPVRQTGFQNTAGMAQTNTFDNWMVVTPDVVARAIIQGMERGRNLVIPGRGFGLIHKLSKRLPDAWVIRLSKMYLQHRP